MDVSGLSGSTAPQATLSDPAAAALSGMADAQNQMTQAAAQLTAGPPTPEVMLDLSQANIQFAASAEVLKVSQDNSKKLLDMLA